MPQPIDTSPPWWDGTIAIPFSVEEWEEIRMALQNEWGRVGHEPYLNLIDRIEKGIGEE